MPRKTRYRTVDISTFPADTLIFSANSARIAIIIVNASGSQGSISLGGKFGEGVILHCPETLGTLYILRDELGDIVCGDVYTPYAYSSSVFVTEVLDCECIYDKKE